MWTVSDDDFPLLAVTLREKYIIIRVVVMSLSIATYRREGKELELWGVGEWNIIAFGVRLNYRASLVIQTL